MSAFVNFVRGDPLRLDGRLIAFVRLLESPDSDDPLASLVHRGVLAVQGNYRDQRTMADFFRKEFGISMEEGLTEILDNARELGGLEAALDPEAVRERLGRMGTSDALPIPARVVAFEPGAPAWELFDGDIVELGLFGDLHQAHLAVNAFPILYQARYREQERSELRVRIEEMLERLSPSTPETDSRWSTFQGDLEDHLWKSLLPDILYARPSSQEDFDARSALRRFMESYTYPEDVEKMLGLMPAVRNGDSRARRNLELLVRKVSAINREDFGSLESIRRDLADLGSSA